MMPYLYVGSLRILKQVLDDGSLSPSRKIPTLWMVKGGFREANPRLGGLSQLVTNRKRAACCLPSRDANTLQKREIVGSIPVNPPAY